MRMQVNIERHQVNARLQPQQWKASVSRSGPWFVKHWATAGKVLFCGKAALLKGARDSHSSIQSFFCFRPGSMNSHRRSESGMALSADQETPNAQRRTTKGEVRRNC